MANRSYFRKFSLLLLFLFGNVSANYISKCPFAISSDYNRIPKAGGCAVPPSACETNYGYRSADGSCNNLYNSGYGMSRTIFNRLLPAKYADNIFMPQTAKSGYPLPSARAISNVVFPEQRIQDPKWTIATVDWGQLVAHDVATSFSYNGADNCCKGNRDPMCIPIPIPANDKIATAYNGNCMELTRSITNKIACNLPNDHSPAEQLNFGSSFLDLDPVYGKTKEDAIAIRAYQGGLLKVDYHNGQEWLPKYRNVSAQCPNSQNKYGICYKSGDPRNNMTPQQSLLVTILYREHNRIARELAKHMAYSSDEKLYQEARKINIAQYQYITYYEYLPILLGGSFALESTLIHRPADLGQTINDYNPSINPSTLNAFAAAAFRYPHNSIYGIVVGLNKLSKVTGSSRLSDVINDAGIIEFYNAFEELARGALFSSFKLQDTSIDPEIKHYFMKGFKQFGKDLKAIDIQRARDHGIRTYNEYRVLAGLKRAYSWEDYLDVISPKDLYNLKAIYASYEDCELNVCGALEAHIPGTTMGPTFAYITKEQFYRLRVGDRFFFENQQNGFSPAQIRQIRKASLSKLYCSNVKGLDFVQPAGFLKPSALNPAKPCNVLPSIDLSAWDRGYSQGITYKNIMTN